MNSATEWMSDPALAGIPKEKLQFLQNMFFESQKLSDKEKLPFFLSLAQKAKSNHIQFTQEEIDLILPLLRSKSSPEELQKIDKLMNMMKRAPQKK